MAGRGMQRLQYLSFFTTLQTEGDAVTLILSLSRRLCMLSNRNDMIGVSPFAFATFGIRCNNLSWAIFNEGTERNQSRTQPVFMMMQEI